MSVSILKLELSCICSGDTQRLTLAGKANLRSQQDPISKSKQTKLIASFRELSLLKRSYSASGDGNESHSNYVDDGDSFGLICIKWWTVFCVQLAKLAQNYKTNIFTILTFAKHTN